MVVVLLLVLLVVVLMMLLVMVCDGTGTVDAAGRRDVHLSS